MRDFEYRIFGIAITITISENKNLKAEVFSDFKWYFHF